MKKLFILLSLACMGLAVSSCYDDSELWESVNGLESRVKTLETLCSEMNTNISSLQDLAVAVQKGGYITEVTPLTENGVEVGYKVTLNDGRMVTIYHGKNGSAGNAPQIGVKQDSDGKYYWVVGGEWIKDDKGNKVPVSSGTTPKIKVENGKWCVSYDGGTTWEELGAATASDTCLFDDVTYTNGVLTLKFADGNVLSFPIGDTFRIVLGDFDPNWGNRLEIPYTIKGATGEVMLFSMCYYLEDEEMMVAEVIEETESSGKIVLEMGYWEDDEYWWDDDEWAGRIMILASDESGTTVSKILNFVSGVLCDEDDKDYIVGSEGGQLAIKVTTNRTLKVNTLADWITHVDTKAVEERTLLFDVEANDGNRRQTEIEVISGDMKLVFPVAQKTGGDAVFSVNLQYNELTGGLTSFSLENDLDYGGGFAVSAPRNSKGQKLYEYMGYETWQDFADAVGNYDTFYAFAGDVVITAYDVKTGLSYGNVDYYYSSPSYYFMADGDLMEGYDNDYMIQFNWYMSGDKLSDQINCSLNSQKITAGETYSFGIMVSSESAEALIEVNIEITEYIDPEAGMYDKPSEPGRYEFYLSDEYEITQGDSDISAKSYVYNTDIMEQIKSIMGMTAFDIYKHVNKNDIDIYFMTEDNEKYYTSSSQFDIDGDMVRNYYSSRDYLIKIGWNCSAYSNSAYIYSSVSNESGYWTPMVMEAAENNTELNLKYGLEYNGYELIFYHTIKFVVGDEFVDPEAGQYDEPKEPGTYEFDLYDEIELPKESNFFWKAYSIEDAYESIKETLGMTTYELYCNKYEFESYFISPDGTETDGNSSLNLNVGGLTLGWSICNPNEADNNFNLFSWNYDITTIENGKEITYKYVIEYKEYELVFNHTIKFKWAESAE